MIPRRIGPYSIVEEIGSRAFTTTYRAEQPRLGRTVLLRALKPTVDRSSPFAQELEREANVLARLEHPGIVRLYDFLESKDASCLVLEDLHGVALPLLTLAIKLTPDQAAAITLDVARALGHAHERGVVHRGLRPSVIELVVGGVARIVDFSQAAAARLASLPEPIEVGDPLASPGSEAALAAAAIPFTPPEQILGEPVDARVDVWALGALFYTLAAGAPPFTQAKVDDDGADDDEGAHEAAGHEMSHRVRTAAPAQIVDLPRPYERLLALCLAKDPADRLADGSAVAALIAEALEEREVGDTAQLVAHALATAKLAEPVAHVQRGPRRPRPRAATGERREPSIRRATRTLPFVLGATVVAAFLLEAARDPEASATSQLGDGPLWAGLNAGPPGHLRVVATPWAEIYVDGEHVETTPIARPLPLRPGRHWITLKHPAAPNEARSIKVLPGQTVFLDVAMRITAPPPDAGKPNPDDSP